MENIHSSSSKISGKWFATQGSHILTPETESIIKSFGKGYKVVNVQKGIHADSLKEGLKITTDLDMVQSQPVLKDISQILGIDKNLETVIVMIGGLELVKEKMEEIKKSMKKIDTSKIKELAQKLGLTTETDVLIFTDPDSEAEAGGLFIIQAGLDEIRDSFHL